jgi:hypothetical protein
MRNNTEVVVLLDRWRPKGLSKLILPFERAEISLQVLEGLRTQGRLTPEKLRQLPGMDISATIKGRHGIYIHYQEFEGGSTGQIVVEVYFGKGAASSYKPVTIEGSEESQTPAGIGVFRRVNDYAWLRRSGAPGDKANRHDREMVALQGVDTNRYRIKAGTVRLLFGITALDAIRSAYGGDKEHTVAVQSMLLQKGGSSRQVRDTVDALIRVIKSSR